MAPVAMVAEPKRDQNAFCEILAFELTPIAQTGYFQPLQSVSDRIQHAKIPESLAGGRAGLRVAPPWWLQSSRGSQLADAPPIFLRKNEITSTQLFRHARPTRCEPAAGAAGRLTRPAPSHRACARLSVAWSRCAARVALFSRGADGSSGAQCRQCGHSEPAELGELLLIRVGQVAVWQLAATGHGSV
jgi:hypothetical protein